LPIIAMTAHAMEHEKQASLAAGMSDHLGKPFSTDTFYRLLAKWIPAERQYREQAPAPAKAEGLPAIEGVDTQAGLHRFAGNQAAYLGWLRKLLDEGDSPLAAVVTHLESGRRDEGLKTLHAFKGRVGMLGLTVLWEAVVALESALKEGQDHQTLLAAAQRHLAATRQLLGSALSAPAEAAP
ncbi:MAG: Hpt domain-containing protein, partial [Actinomycetota bacterium]